MKEPHKYIVEALNCLKNANDLAKKTSCRYLVDLARIHISMGEVESAEDCFIEASQTVFNDNDGTYLFEQWAILSKEIATNADDDELDNIKSLYRQSIEHAVKAKIRSKMAFYNLRDILKSQLETKINIDPDYSDINLEYMLLYKTMEQFSVAEEALKTALEKDPKNVDIILSLIDVFYERYTVNCKTGNNKNSDISAAFTYTIVLKNSGIYDLKLKPEEIPKFLDIARRKEEIKDKARRNLENKSEEENQTGGNLERESRQDSAFKEIFNWMIKYACLKDYRFTGSCQISIIRYMLLLRVRPKFGSGFGFGAETGSFTLSVLVLVACVTDSAEFRYQRNWSSSFSVNRNYCNGCNLPKRCSNNDCKPVLIMTVNGPMRYSNYRQLLI